MAVTYEDGPYGVSVKTSNLSQAEKYKMKVVLTEGYDHKTKDLSSLVLKLKAAKPDAILNTGYYPDIVLFFRQAREMGLPTKAIIGHGAGYANFPNLEKQLGREIIQYVYDIDPAPAQDLDKKKLQKEIGPIIDEFLKRYNEKYKEADPPSHATQGFGHAWILLQTIEQAIKKYGAPTADNIRKAALELDIPEGATPCGYGVKFAPPEHKFAGENLTFLPGDYAVVEREDGARLAQCFEDDRSQTTRSAGLAFGGEITKKSPFPPSKVRKNRNISLTLPSPVTPRREEGKHIEMRKKPSPLEGGGWVIQGIFHTFIAIGGAWADLIDGEIADYRC